MYNKNSLANLGPPRFTKENASFFGKIGGSRKTVAKQRAAIIRGARKRKCETCNWLEHCNIGHAQLKVAPKDQVQNVTCALPTRQLVILSKLVNGEYEELYMNMLFWLQQEARTFSDRAKVMERLDKLLIQKSLNVNLNREERDTKIEVIIVDPKSSARKGTKGSEPKTIEGQSIDEDSRKA